MESGSSLDDATAFIKTRSYYDERNRDLVPIYQRILEYSDSILFLNMNLSGGIDNSTMRLRKEFISLRSIMGLTDTTKSERRTEGDIEKLAQTPKSYGRVGDVFRKAQILAMELQTPMSLEHVRIVTRLREADAGQD